MKILIRNNDYLESYSRGLVIKRYGNEPKDGEEQKFKVLGYHTSLEHAFEALLRRRIIESEAESFQELLEEIKEHRKEIRSLLGLGSDTEIARQTK